MLSQWKCVFSVKCCQFYEINFFWKIQHMKCNGICDFWSLEYKCRKSSWTMLLSLETFIGYLKKKTWEKFGRFCWYSVNLTNFVILLENFMKFSISQNWKKKLLFMSSVFFWGQNGDKKKRSSKERLLGEKQQIIAIFRGEKVQIPRFRRELQAYH